MPQYSLLVCITALCSLVGAQVRPAHSSVVLAKESAALGNIDVERLRLSLQYLQEEIGGTKTAPPDILLIHLSKQAAEALGLHDGIFLERATEVPDSHRYYEVVLTGEYAIRAYVFIACQILENHNGMNLDEAARNALVDRVTRKVSSTVSTSELQHLSTLHKSEAVGRPPITTHAETDQRVSH